MERISRDRFIRVGAALGVSAASAAVLAACGGGTGGSGGGDTGGSTGSSGGATTTETGSSETTRAQSGSSDSGASGGAIASESEVSPGSAKKFKDGGKDAVLVRLDSGDFVAYSAVCTHQGCTVAYKDGQLACPCHGSVFDPANGGAVVTPPAEQPLPEIPVKVEGGNVVKA